ncbi:MAG TPA: TIGR03936 family radical SAM-associated protein [Planctomycetota bacterium]
MTAAATLWRYCVEFAKGGPARFVSHLDMQEAFERALRRARLPLAFSQGFHPRPRMQFEDPLPLGWSSECERVWVELAERYPAAEMFARLSASAPPGVAVRRVFVVQGHPAPPPARRYRVTGLPAPDAAALQVFAPAEAGAQEPVSWRAVEESLEFTLRPSGTRPAPSMKKVLRAIAGEELPEGLRVHRVAWESDEEFAAPPREAGA